MDYLLIKTNNAGDKAAPGPTGRDSVTALAGLAAGFKDLLHKTGMRIESGVRDIADRAGISAVSGNVEPAQPADNYGRRLASDERDRFEDRPRADQDVDRQSDDRGVETANDYARDHGVEYRDGRDDAGRDHGAEHRDGRDDAGRDDYGTSHADEYAGDKNDAHAARDDAPASKDTGGDAKSESGDGTKAGGKEDSNQSAGTDAVTAQAGVSAEATTAVLTGLVAGGEAHTSDGPASEQGKVSAADGLVTATSATATDDVSKVTPVSTGKSGDRETQHQSQGSVYANAQAKTVAADPSAVKAEGEDSEEPASQTTVESQASGLAKAMGGGNRAQVSVTVTNESQTLVSKPGATFSANTVISGEGSSQSSGGQSANTHSQGGGQAAAAQTAAQQAQAAATQSQSAQNAATQASAQAGNDARGLVQAQAASGNAGGTVHAGGGESGGQSGTGGITGGQQSQQTQAQSEANQANDTHKPARTGHSVVNQITVKITKAIQAGNDKITIQLRPANMGRVEVKMELSHDNRLVALVTADSRETLELLQKDSRELQRALQEAGLRTDAGDLNFNLRGQDGQDADGGGNSTGASSIEEELASIGGILAGEPVVESDGGVYVNGRIDVRA
ncbi:MAG: flagellar hook-length control protein FliK [Rhodospirillales bacterium]